MSAMKIREIHPQAVYKHCLAHKLNLVVVDSSTNILEIIRFFKTIEALNIHFSNPGNHERLQKIKTALGIKNRSGIGS